MNTQNTGYGIYTWEGYNIDGECVCGGRVYANNTDDAYDKVSEMIENEYDDYAADGYFNHKIIGFEEN